MRRCIHLTHHSIAVDIHDANLPESDPNHISLWRMGYRTTGTLGSIGVSAVGGAAAGGPVGFAAGVLVGGAFYADEKSFDGIVWFGGQVSQAVAQFNSA